MKLGTEATQRTALFFLRTGNGLLEGGGVLKMNETDLLYCCRPPLQLRTWLYDEHWSHFLHFHSRKGQARLAWGRLDAIEFSKFAQFYPLISVDSGSWFLLGENTQYAHKISTMICFFCQLLESKTSGLGRPRNYTLMHILYHNGNNILKMNRQSRITLLTIVLSPSTSTDLYKTSAKIL